MFIGHLPAGYLVSAPLARRAGLPPHVRRRVVWLGLAASVLPDLDLVYFFTLGRRQHVHHTYLPHLPAFWAAVLTAAALVLAVARPRYRWIACAVVGINLFLHLALDTVAGGVLWLWPASDASFVLAEVPARYRPWYLNFVLHWTFWLELALVAAALLLMLHYRTRSRGGR
jgi:inner membrane protein